MKSSIVNQTYLVIRCVFLFSVFCYEVSASDENSSTHRPGKAERVIAKVVVKLISKQHFSHKKFNDDLSEQLFNSYFTSLDPQKLYFLGDDLEHYSNFKLILDDSLDHGQIEFAYSVFDTFVQRVQERVLYIEKTLHESFDFSQEEELLIERKKAAWCTNARELDDLWSQRLKNDFLGRLLKTQDDEKNEPKKEALEKLKQTLESKNYTEIKISDLAPKITYEKIFLPYRNYLQRLKNRDGIDILEIFLTALAKLYDPHSAYMAPKTKEDFDISMKLSLEGIGARLKEKNGEIIISEIMVGGAADNDGRLKEKDRIIAVSQDGVEFVDVETMTLRNVIGLIRGPKESHVFLKVKANGAESNEVRIIEIVRDIIDLKDREAKLLKKRVILTDADVIDDATINLNLVDGEDVDIGIITLPSFYTDFDKRGEGDGKFRSASHDVLDLLSEVNANEISGVIVDLRSNRGGSLDEAVKLAGLFIDKGPIVQVKYANGRKKILDDTDDITYYDGPLIVLVDRYSASASEIFAAAIQDYKRGLIIGDKFTYGKGTIQTLHDLDHRLKNRRVFKNQTTGTLKLTTGKFYRINGSSTQHEGVIPDIVYPSVRDYHKTGERSLDHVLPWDSIESLSIETFSANDELHDILIDNVKRRKTRNSKFSEIVNAVESYDGYKKDKFVCLNYLQRKQYEERKKVLLDDVKRFRRKRKTKNELSKNDWLLEEAMINLAILVKLHDKRIRSLSNQDIYEPKN